MKNSMLITIILVVVVGTGAFYAGTKYQQSKRTAIMGQFGGQAGQRMGFGGDRTGFRPVNGEILSTDDKSITVKLQDGSSKIVLFTDTTSFNKSAEGSKSDLKKGEKIAVFGRENSDGSVTAQNIQLNPVSRNAVQVSK
ncbi:MAG: DUF5666 domain-containing protein [Candidatus Levybacteria bacterium]|nr:DUF5666 domain-containing protein [Candidatus Levybacteria bacterium]